MLGTYICRRKLPAALCTLALFAFATTALYYTGRPTVSQHQPSKTQPLETKPTYSDYFETYVNYSGPLPIPGPIELSSPIRYALNEADMCAEQRHPGMRILHYVHSAPQHFKQRKFIRRTWASHKFYSQFKMVTVFILGRTSNVKTQGLIKRESEKYRDIVQVDFEDTYYNLTYKAVSSLAWISEFCSQVEYVVKTDDDVFVNVFRLMEILFGNNTSSDAIYCSVYTDGAPHRNPKSKWFVAKAQYPWNKYPDFCAGMAIYYAGNLVSKLYGATPHVPYLMLDDVYVTGILRSHAKITIKDIGSVVNIFAGNTCLQKGHESEVFCHVESAKLKEEMWMHLMMTEIKARARKSEDDRIEYTVALEEILHRDLE